MNLLLLSTAFATLLFTRAMALEISPDYLVKHKAAVRFSLQSTSAIGKVVPGAVDALQAAKLSPGVEFSLILPDLIDYTWPSYSHRSFVEISPETARKIVVATCGLFNNLPRGDAPFGEKDGPVPGAYDMAADPSLPKDHFRVKVIVEVDGLRMEYDTRLISNKTRLPKEFLGLLQSIEPYSPDWAQKLTK